MPLKIGLVHKLHRLQEWVKAMLPASTLNSMSIYASIKQKSRPALAWCTGKRLSPDDMSPFGHSPFCPCHLHLAWLMTPSHPADAAQSDEDKTTEHSLYMQEEGRRLFHDLNSRGNHTGTNVELQAGSNRRQCNKCARSSPQSVRKGRHHAGHARARGQ